jgi:hypothetical protein
MLLLIGCMFFPMIGFAKAMPDSLHIGVQNDTSEWKPIHVEYIHAAANVEPKGKDTIQNVSDTTYFKTYSDQITGRFYFSRKYTSLVIGDQQSEFKLDYRPNTSLNMGVGATYKNITLNIAYGFPFLNQDEGKGKTRYLDLQAHMYGKKLTIDFFGQFYNGLYLNPKGKGTLDGSYYVRPDMKLREIGLSCQYLFNHKRFSYRASFLQNEWQRKSAGTFLLGGEGYVGWAQADSGVFPKAIPVANPPVATEVRFFEFGPNAGYAYTLVIARHFFITGSLAIGLDYNRTDYRSELETKTSEDFSTNTHLRLFAGYNSERSAVSFTFTNNAVSLTAKRAYSVSINTGNVRLNYVRRFSGGPKTRKFLNWVDGIFKKG